jgi:peptidyl-tRNA hydrolase, PTH1 family
MIFICLGNPGADYKNTKHNTGKMFGDFVAKKLKVKSEKLKNKGKIIELENGWQVVLLDCYMNNSGSCLKSLLTKCSMLNEQMENLFVVHDDLDIPFGEFKIHKNRGAAGHKGVESIIEALGTENFSRVRIGIGRPPDKIPPEKYVLMHFTKEEKETLEEVFEEILKVLSLALRLASRRSGS